MTPSPPLSPKSPASSRPSSIASNPPRPPPQSSSSHHLSTHTMGVAPAQALPTRQHSAEELIEITHPISSSSRVPEEPTQRAEHESGIGSRLPAEHVPARSKKKRTRTLTTPQQSAVLHALLAQSRFPTTAMREEVGRSIGLSARKVQVWFQNQRQKARKPRRQGSLPPGESPQLESPRPGSQSETAPVAGPSRSSASFRRDSPPDVHPQRMYTLEHHTASVSSFGTSAAAYTDMPQYSPSGVAEPSSSRNPSLVPSQSLHHRSLGHDVDTRGSPTTTSISPPFAYAPPPLQRSLPRSQATFPPDPYDRRRSLPPALRPEPPPRPEPPIVLPPLRFDQPRGGQTLPPPPIYHNEPRLGPDPSRSAPLSAHSSSASSIASSPVQHFPGSFTLPPPPSHHPESIPPPFTLQPRPQWDPSDPLLRPMPALSPPSGLSESSRSFPGIPSHRGRRNSDPTRRLPPILPGQGYSQDIPPSTAPQPQSGLPSISSTTGRRFDPVHAALREGESASRQLGEGERSTTRRRNRHTYDFTGSGMPSSSRPPASNDDDDNMQRSE